MAPRDLTSKVIILAHDGTGSTFREVERKIDRLARRGGRVRMMGDVDAMDRRVGALDRTFDRIHRYERAGRSMSAAVTIPTVLAAKSGYDALLAFEKQVNKAEALGELTEEQAKKVRSAALEISKAGQFTAESAAAQMRTYIQAGRTVDQAIGMTQPTLNFAAFGDVDPKKAADVVTSVASAYRVPMRNLEEAKAQATRIGDILAKAANISKADVGDLSQGFKIAAPIAARMGVSMEQLAASIATMNQNGLRGDEAGTALRSSLVRLVKPTLDSRQAMAELGLSFEDFSTKAKAIDVDDFASGMKQTGINVDKIKGQLRRKIGEKTLENDRAEITNILREEVLKMTKGGAQDKRTVAKAVTKYVSSLTDEIDFDRLWKALDDKKVTPGQIARIFDQRQGARLSTMIGGQYEEFVRTLTEEAAGSAERGAKTMMKGLVGADRRIRTSFNNMALAIGDAGATDALINVLDGITRGVKALSSTSPEVLKWTTYAVTAAAAIGPLAIALSKLASLAGWVAGPAGGGAVSGGVAAGAAAGGAGALGKRILGSRAAVAARFGAYGMLAYGGYQAGQGARAVGQIAAGRYYTPSDAAGVADLEAQVKAIEAKIQGINERVHPSRRGEFNPETDQLGRQKQELENRVRSANERVELLRAKEKEADQKLAQLRSIDRLGIHNAGDPLGILAGKGASFGFGPGGSPTAPASKTVSASLPPSRPASLPQGPAAPPMLKDLRDILGPGKLEATVKPDQITSKLEGSATVKLDLNLKLDSKLEAKIDKAIQAAGHLSAAGAGGAVGSTGKTMPEAGSAE